MAVRGLVCYRYQRPALNGGGPLTRRKADFEMETRSILLVLPAQQTACAPARRDRADLAGHTGFLMRASVHPPCLVASRERQRCDDVGTEIAALG